MNLPIVSCDKKGNNFKLVQKLKSMSRKMDDKEEFDICNSSIIPVKGVNIYTQGQFRNKKTFHLQNITSSQPYKNAQISPKEDSSINESEVDDVNSNDIINEKSLAIPFYSPSPLIQRETKGNFFKTTKF